MFIIAEKPSVAKDFAKALNCIFSNGVWKNTNNNIVITNCIGHLFSLAEPDHYKTPIPIIPEKFEYIINEATEKQSKLVLSLLAQHKDDDILIATDADREGEIIARECLSQAHFNDISKIKRFWVSQALTKEVILNGISNAQPLNNYNTLASQGFARQHADWLIGMNFSRYLSSAAKIKLSVGRVQTAILKAIAIRCEQINNFKSSKYFECESFFGPTNDNKSIKGYLINCLSKDIKFTDTNSFSELKKHIGSQTKLIESINKEKTQSAPQLYNLNDLQKDAFKKYSFSADKTLQIVQSLYETLKCVSYPRTPSNVMGSKNVQLCSAIYNKLSTTYHNYSSFVPYANLSLSNTHCYNDQKLEAHHALIPLDILPDTATEEQSKIYNLILNRFFLAFLPDNKYIAQTFIIQVGNFEFKVTGKRTIQEGWKQFSSEEDENQTEDDSQSLDNINWNTLIFKNFEIKEKWTKPPQFYNEASILSFMENPKEENSNTKLVGLGTPATRHTFIPKLQKMNYIEITKKNITITPFGLKFLECVESSPIKKIASISNTTEWEQKLDASPVDFEKEIKIFVKTAVQNNIPLSEVTRVTSEKQKTLPRCPICNEIILEGRSNYYCSGYKKGCKFPGLWKSSKGTLFNIDDVKNLCEMKQTKIKTCKKKDGSTYKAAFILNNAYELQFVKKE